MSYYRSVPHDENDPHTGRLLAASCTTGWLDWIHGELWLFPDGLLRVPLNIIITIAHGPGPTVDVQEPLWRHFEVEELNKLKQKGLWVPRETIKKASLYHTVAMADCLDLALTNGRSVRFLWLPWDNAWEVLRIRLLSWLGSGLVVR